MDNFKNFAKVTVSTGYDASATTIVLTTGHGAKLPTSPFNAVWWNSTDYADPADDPNVEVVRVTSISTDTLTVTRGQESITATTKNTGSKLYKMVAAFTAKTLNTEIPNTTGTGAGSLGLGDGGSHTLTLTAQTMTADATVVFPSGPGSTGFMFGTVSGSNITLSQVGYVGSGNVVREGAEASIASAATTNIGAATSPNLLVTGTTTITAFDNVADGITRCGRFNGILTLTNNSNIVLPGGTNITTAANDYFEALSKGSGVWHITRYVRANGTPIAAPYAPATSGSSILMGNGSGGFTNAVAGTNFCAAPSGSAVQKANGSGALVAATQGTDFLAPVTEASIASASTTDLGSNASTNASITGTTTITSLGSTAATGKVYTVRFAGALTLTHNGTSLILPSGANIPTVAGDTMTAEHLGSGNWKVVDYTRADGTALIIKDFFEFALSDETTALTTGTGKLAWRAPFAFTILSVRGSVSVVSSSGLPTVNIKKNGTTVFSTKLTLDASEKTSVTAATPAVLSTTAVADDDELTFDIDVAGTSTAGLKVKIYYSKP